MADEPNRFAVLLERFAQGDEQAARELFDQYRKALMIVIHNHLDLSPQLRLLFDSVDFLQDLWQDIAAQPDKLHDFATFKELLNYLTGTARHKIETARRKYLTAQKRDLRRNRHLSEQTVATAAEAIIDPRPDPAQESASNEFWSRWLQSLSPRQRHIVLMLRAGFTHQAIAADLGCSGRSISRLVAKIRHIPVADM